MIENVHRLLRELELESQAGYGYLNLSHRPVTVRCHWPHLPALPATRSRSPSRVSTVTVTDSNSNIESESASQYAQAAQRLRGDDSGGRGLRQQPARGAAAAAAPGDRVSGPAAWV